MKTMKALKVTDTETDPNDKSKRNKIIAIIALVCALTGITAAILHPHSQVEQVATCQNQQQVFTDKQAQLDQTIQEAKDALASVDASLEPGEGTRLMHTDGFPLSAEGQKAIADLDKATDKAKKFKNDNTVPQCPGEQDTRASTRLSRRLRVKPSRSSQPVMRIDSAKPPMKPMI